MFRVILVLLFSVNVAFAQVQRLTQNEFANAPMNAGLIPCLVVGETGLQLHGMLMKQPQEDSRQNRIYAAAIMFGGDYRRQGSVQRSGTGRFIVGAIATVMVVAVPVQRFINVYSSYDSGENQYCRPAVHVQPNINRGSAWVSVELRL
jgi:hypothetical protein